MSASIDVPTPSGTIPTLIAGPSVTSDGPAVVVIPSIFGPAPDLLHRLGEAVTDRALVAVPDPFWRTGEGPVAYDDMDTAFGRMAEFDIATCFDEMTAVVAWAREQGNGHVIGLGICFGGPYVLRLAARGLLDGLVTWHGSRMEQFLKRADDIDCPVRHHLGSADPVSPPEAVEAICSAFSRHPDAEIVVHDGATHGFSHDGDAFDADACAAGLASVAELVDRLRS